MKSNITPEMLFAKVQTEKATGDLQPLPSDFYAEANAMLEELGATKTGGEPKYAENAQKMLATLKERRQQKLLTYIAFGKSTPQLPTEEEDLYNEIRNILNKSANGKVARLRVVANIPEVLTAQGRKIGPFKQGDVIEVSNSGDAEFIIKNKIAEPVSQ